MTARACGGGWGSAASDRRRPARCRALAPAEVTVSTPDNFPEQSEDVDPRPAARPKAEKQAPGTIRLNEQAGRSLWESYLEAKTDDPFLSYRQFASAVVLDGLASRQRRHKR